MGQNMFSNTRDGGVCWNNDNNFPCRDYEVQFISPCDITVTLLQLSAVCLVGIRKMFVLLYNPRRKFAINLPSILIVHVNF